MIKQDWIDLQITPDQRERLFAALNGLQLGGADADAVIETMETVISILHPDGVNWYRAACDLDRQMNHLGRSLEAAQAKLDSTAGPDIARITKRWRSKLAMVDAALRTILFQMGDAGAELEPVWFRLFEKCRKLSTRRNYLAHWNVVIMSDRPGRSARLTPQTASPAYLDYAFGKKCGYTAREIDNIAKAFELLSCRLYHFVSDFASRPELRSIFCGQVASWMQNYSWINPSVLSQIKRDLSWPE